VSSGLQLSGATAQINAFVRGLTLKQKLLMGGSAAVVIGTLFYFVTLMNKPDYKPLVASLSPADAQSLNAKLAAKGIHSQLTPEGTGVEVPSEQLDQARLEVSGAGMPSGGRMGFELFDKPNWMGSDFAEKVNYQRALEGELERTIASIQEVESARVHLVLERESLFTEREREAKAAVVLKLKRQLSPETASAISQLVANAVDGLNPANVTLVSADGHVPLLPKSKGPFGLTDGDLEASLTQQLIATLEPVLGAEHVKANVRVEYDTATNDETKETYDPNSAVAITKQSTKEHSPGAFANGIPGTASNVPSTTTAVPKPAVTVADSGSSSETESATYAVNRTVHHTSQPAGAIKRISAAVMVDDGGKPRSPEQLKKIESIASAALGIDAKRGDTLVVENMAFQVPAADPVSKVTIVQKVTRVAHEWTGALRILGILGLFLVVYLMILRPVKKQVLTTAGQLVAQNAKAAQTADQKNLAADGTSAAVNIRKEIGDRVKAEPEVASKLLQSWIRNSEAHS
jgi:flagellar M-ring protein FliF